MNDPFPAVPAGWFYACDGRDLDRRPRGFDVMDARRVAFRSADGRPAVLDGRCSHMGADLSRGTVDAGTVRCPLHAWAYAADGRCTHVPAGGPVPPFARQAAFPTAEVGGHVFFYNGPTAAYPMPFFDGVDPADLRPARPFELVADAPWYLVGANGFDLQHFGVAHDRTLVAPPTVDGPSPFARRLRAEFDVTGSSWQDRVTRRLSGPRVHMSITVWSGTLSLVTATFRRTTTYGLASITPLRGDRSHVRVIVWVPRRASVLGPVLDPVDARVRRSFVRAFLRPDVIAGAGTRWSPATLIDADRTFASYLDWLAETSAGRQPRGAA